MKQSTKDRFEGKAHEAKGAVKEKTGQMTGNRDLQDRGHDEKIAGKIQSKVGQTEHALER